MFYEIAEIAEIATSENTRDINPTFKLLYAREKKVTKHRNRNRTVKDGCCHCGDYKGSWTSVS